jgi:hypothetical protein
MKVSRHSLTQSATAVLLATTGFGDPLIIRNLGAGTLYIGHDATATNLTGYPLTAFPLVNCEADLLNYGGQVFGYADGGNCDVAVVEEISG